VLLKVRKTNREPVKNEEEEEEETGRRGYSYASLRLASVGVWSRDVK